MSQILKNLVSSHFFHRTVKWLQICQHNMKFVNSQAGVARAGDSGCFRLLLLSLSSYSKTVEKYTPQIEYRGFFEIIHFYARRLWDPQNAFENFRQRLYLLWCLLVLYFWRLISVQLQ